MLPCLTFSDNRFEWKLTEKEHSVHKPLLNNVFKTESPVVQVVRHDRSYVTVWTTDNQLYEIRTVTGNNVHLRIKSSIPPSYANGWYIGLSKGAHTYLYLVNRNHPEEMHSLSHENSTITDIIYIPYTHWLITNAEDGCYRVEVDTRAMTLGDDIPLADRYRLSALDTMDSSALALAHDSGHISVFWISSWKLQHRIVSSTVHCMAVNCRFLVAAVGGVHTLQVWDLVSGDLTTVIASAWHRPLHLSLVNYVDELGIVSVDTNNNVLASWCVNGKKSCSWKVMEITSKVDLVCTVPLCESETLSLGENTLYLYDGVFLKQTYIGFKDTMFTWQREWQRWLLDASNIPKNVDFDNEMLVRIMKPTILSSMFTWSKMVLHENIYEEFVKTLLTDEEIFERFSESCKAHLIYLYDTEGFDTRFKTQEMINYVVKCGMDIKTIFSLFEAPETDSDYMCWLSGIHTEPSIVNESIVEDVWKSSKSNNAMEFLYHTQQHILNWELFLKDERVFQFVRPGIVEDSCKQGFVNEWLALFEKIKDMDLHYKKNVETCWATFVRFVFEPQRLEFYNYPNNADGTWTEIAPDTVPSDAWVVVNETIVNAFNVDLKDMADIKIQAWIPKNTHPNNPLERALNVLDRTKWERSVIWDTCNGPLASGYRVKHKDKEKGVVVDWPEVLMDDGTDRTITVLDDYTFLKNTGDFSIDDTLFWKTEQHIIRMVAEGDITNVDNMYKSSILDLLKPTTTKEIRTVVFREKITAFNVDRAGIAWLGKDSGDIAIKYINDPVSSVIWNIENAHTNTVTGIDFGTNMTASCSLDCSIRVWNEHFQCTQTFASTYGILNVRMFDHSIWFVNESFQTCVWNTTIGSPPVVINDSGEQHYSVVSMDSVGNTVLIATHRTVTPWDALYPHTKKHVHYDSTISCVAFITDQDYVCGTLTGEVWCCSVQDDSKLVIWQDPEETITTILPLVRGRECGAVVGTKSGKIFIMDIIKDTEPIIVWSANYEIVKLHYLEPYIIVFTKRYCMHTMIFDRTRIHNTAKALNSLIQHQSWKLYISNGNNNVKIKNIVLKGFQYAQFDFDEVINLMIEEYDNRKDWCTHDIMDILMNRMEYHPEKYTPIFKKLFCFRGKLFTCTLCLGSSVSPKRTPVSLLKTCGHKFHTKCIHQHVEKTTEWHGVCQTQWALPVDLTCPQCRTPFTPDDIMEDKLFAEVCRYNSDED